MIAKAKLDQALEAWEVARERARLEMLAWFSVTQSHAVLIASLRATGHNWSQAQTEFAKLSEFHREAHLASWEEMDRRCGEYQMLLEEYNAQQ